MPLVMPLARDATDATQKLARRPVRRPTPKRLARWGKGLVTSEQRRECTGQEEGETERCMNVHAERYTSLECRLALVERGEVEAPPPCRVPFACATRCSPLGTLDAYAGELRFLS